MALPRSNVTKGMNKEQMISLRSDLKALVEQKGWWWLKNAITAFIDGVKAPREIRPIVETGDIMAPVIDHNRRIAEVNALASVLELVETALRECREKLEKE